MKFVFLGFLAILALNALVILAITGMLLLDHLKSRRRRVDGGASSDDAQADAS